MHSEEPEQATDDDGQTTPFRGENEEDADDESWHDARDDWWGRWPQKDGPIGIPDTGYGDSGGRLECRRET